MLIILSSIILRQDGGKYIVFFSGEDKEWLNTEFHAGNTTSGTNHHKNLNFL